MEFRIVPNNPQTRALSLCFAIPFLVILLVNLILFATSVVDAETALELGLFLTLAPAAAIWNVQQYGRGSASLESSELLVRTRGSTRRYPWADIADVRLTSFRERGAVVPMWTRIVRWSETKPFVELRLKRPTRVGLWPGRYGTRLFGVPLIGGTRISLFLADAVSFVQTAKSYLPKTGQLPT